MLAFKNVSPSAVLRASVFYLLFLVNSMANPLETFRWEYRILLIRAESFETAALDITKLESSAAGVDERQLLWIVGNSELLRTNKPNELKAISKDRLWALIEQQKLPAEKVLLFGKDGGLKERYNTLDIPAIFAKIDSMPMRRSEMKKRL
jgi:hypothetical protein